MLAAHAPGRPDSRFVLEDFEPAYMEVCRCGEFPARVEAVLAELEDCRACPRNCGVNRLKDEIRVCHIGRHAIVSSAFPHFGEEDCLRGWNGSGTIFFGLCNLRCVFCQNWDISQNGTGMNARRRTSPTTCWPCRLGVPQHQFRHPGTRGAPGHRGHRRGRALGSAPAHRQQHQRL